MSLLYVTARLQSVAYVTHIKFILPPRSGSPMVPGKGCAGTIITRYCGMVKGRFRKIWWFCQQPSVKKSSDFCVFCRNPKIFSLFSPFSDPFARHPAAFGFFPAPQGANRCPHNILWFPFVAETALLLKKSPLFPPFPFPARRFPGRSAVPRRRHPRKSLEKSAFFVLFHFSYRFIHAIIGANPSVFRAKPPGAPAPGLAQHYIYTDRGGYSHEKENF